MLFISCHLIWESSQAYGVRATVLSAWERESVCVYVCAGEGRWKQGVRILPRL